MNIKIKVKNGVRVVRRITHGNCYAAYSAARVSVRLGHFIPTPHFNHIFATLQNLRFRLFGLQKRQLPGTLGEIIFELSVEYIV